MSVEKVENPMVLPQIDPEQHFGVDATGNEVLVGDSIVVIDGEMILESNIVEYLIEFHGAEKKVAGEK